MHRDRAGPLRAARGGDRAELESERPAFDRLFAVVLDQVEERGGEGNHERRVGRDDQRDVDLDPIGLQRRDGREISLVPGQRVGQEPGRDRLDEAADEPQVVFEREADEDRHAHRREQRERALYVSMKNGVISFKRMDMLIMDTYAIATWGNVDLAANKVNMIIGLTGQALQKGFNIQGLGKDYVAQIPFKGPIDNASIDKKKAAAKIAALVASNRGPEGLLIGTALHIASGGLKEEKAPPPTTNPLPWSTGEESSQPTNSKPDSNHPLHQVEEKATSLLKNLIPFN